MLRNLRRLAGLTVRATDGDIGRVEEFYFDDARWTIRYLVVNTGNWLTRREVLVSPYALDEVDWEEDTLHVNLTLSQVENSPDIDTRKPVSRQHEIQYSGYYGWPHWWVGPGLWGPLAYPGVVQPAPEIVQGADEEHPSWTDLKTMGDPHLRSTREITGYAIHARDGEIGHVADFIADDRSWEICHLVVDTGHWWPGKKVLVPIPWIEAVTWPEARVTVDLDRATIKNGPEWDPSTPISREYEERLQGYYRRPTFEREPELAGRM
jgi:uncharacterized protein YrrD